MMATARLFDALPDFGPRLQPRLAAENQSVDPHAREESRSPRPDTGEILRSEVARAEEALSRRLSQESEAVLEALRAQHAAEMAEQARQFGEYAGEIMATRLGEMASEVSEHVAAAVARIVGGLLSEDLQKRSIDVLARSVRAAIADRDTIRIEIRGPQSLYAALAAALPDRTGSLDYIEREGFDLTVTVDGDLFETRLGEWSSALSEILT